MGGQKAKVLEPGEGRSLTTVGVSVSLKSVAEDTDGRWTIYEYTPPPRFPGPPPHWHKETDADAHAGGYARVPPGVVHRFSNPSDAPGRFLGLIVPGGFETYWEELGEMMASEPFWPPADMGPLIALMATPSHRRHPSESARPCQWLITPSSSTNTPGQSRCKRGSPWPTSPISKRRAGLRAVKRAAALSTEPRGARSR